ncbi:MAG: hypothetical protein P8X98_14345, partial [Woeseiaceae bacterium]
LFGLAATGIAEEPRDRILGAARAVADTMFVIIEWILAVAPLGVHEDRVQREGLHLPLDPGALDPAHAVADNLLKQNFSASRPNQHWAADITYSAPSLGRRLEDAA